MLAAVGVVALLYLAAVGSVNDATTELETANATNTALQAETAKYAEVQSVYAQAAAAQAMPTQAMGEEVRFSQYLNDLSLTVPEDVWLQNVTFKQAAAPAALGTTEPGIGQVTFTGVGFKHDDVAVWLESLAKQKGYTNPYFHLLDQGLDRYPRHRELQQYRHHDARRPVRSLHHSGWRLTWTSFSSGSP